MRIGFYAHHHGSGHLRRARTIAAELRDRGHVVEIASSRQAPGVDVELPLDNAEDPRIGFPDPDAGGAFHWAPAHNAGLRARMARLAQWVAEFRPDVVHVDVSVEVAVYLRLMGVPVTVQAMPGVRDDAPHQLAYRIATRIVAAWPDWVPLDESLQPHGARVRRVGGISRFPTRESRAAGEDDALVVVLRGAGGHALDDEFWERVARETGRLVPHLKWRILGGKDTLDDPSPLLRTARVVISAAGQNSVADIAACGAPAFITAEDRPFGEQQATAAVLYRAGLALEPPRDDTGWPQAIAKAVQGPTLAPKGGYSWQTAGAAARAAHVIEEAGQ